MDIEDLACVLRSNICDNPPPPLPHRACESGTGSAILLPIPGGGAPVGGSAALRQGAQPGVRGRAPELRGGRTLRCDRLWENLAVAVPLNSSVWHLKPCDDISWPFHRRLFFILELFGIRKKNVVCECDLWSEWDCRQREIEPTNIDHVGGHMY